VTFEPAVQNSHRISFRITNRIQIDLSRSSVFMTAFILPCVQNQIAVIQIDVLPGFIIADGLLSRAKGL